jgi:branched-chain amino acid aminotransferase
MQTPLWSFDDWARHHRTAPPAYAAGYYAMYRHDWNAIVTDPRLMVAPVDDHLVHRGDGVFETLLCEEGALYNLGAHLDRLESSGAAIGLALPCPREHLRAVLLGLFRAVGRPRALGRVLLGRGPGGFGVDPAESVGPSLYAIAYAAPAPFMERNPGGARVILSRIPPKDSFLATIKSCNYLPNAMMKAEASRAGAHFAVGMDEDGFLTESYTENLAIIDAGGTLCVPPSLRHLPGTTLHRVAELAPALGLPVHAPRLRAEDLWTAREVWVVGTTAYVSSVVSVDGRAVGGGKPGPWAERLHAALRRDIRENAAMRDPVLH